MKNVIQSFLKLPLMVVSLLLLAVALTHCGKTNPASAGVSYNISNGTFTGLYRIWNLLEENAFASSSAFSGCLWATQVKSNDTEDPDKGADDADNNQTLNGQSAAAWVSFSSATPLVIAASAPTGKATQRIRLRFRARCTGHTGVSLSFVNGSGVSLSTADDIDMRFRSAGGDAGADLRTAGKTVNIDLTQIVSQINALVGSAGASAIDGALQVENNFSHN